jgi:hypothetical protein
VSFSIKYLFTIVVESRRWVELMTPITNNLVSVSSHFSTKSTMYCVQHDRRPLQAIYAE